MGIYFDKLIKIGTAIYICLLLILIISEFIMGYHIRSSIYIQYILFYLFAACAGYEVYNNKITRKMLLILTLSPLMGLRYWYFFSALLLFPRILKADLKLWRILFIPAYLISLVSFILSVYYVSVEEVVVLNKVYNGQSQKALVAQHYLHGETTNVFLNHYIAGDYLYVSKVIYIVRDRNYDGKIIEDMKWVDGNTVEIDGKEINIYKW